MKKIVLTVILFISVALAAELSARTLGLSSPLLYRASSAGYELVPNQTVNLLGRSTHINALGTRGPETTPIPVKGRFRVLVLGDSVANGGNQIHDWQSWPLQMEGILKGRGMQIEVLNASAGGWAIGNAAGWIAEHGTLGAQLILLEVNEKDLDQQFAGQSLLDSNPSFPTRNPSMALGALVERYILPRLGMGASPSDPGSTAGMFQPQNTEEVLEEIGKIRIIAEKNKARFMLLYWDLRLPAPPLVAHARDRLFAYAAQQDVEVIRPSLGEDDSRDHFFRDDIHPNVEGNTAIAEELAQHILPEVRTHIQ